MSEIKIFKLRTDVPFDRVGGGPSQMLVHAENAARASDLMWRLTNWTREIKDPSMITLYGIVKRKAELDLINSLDSIAGNFNQMVASLQHSDHNLKYIKELTPEEIEVLKGQPPSQDGG